MLNISTINASHIIKKPYRGRTADTDSVKAPRTSEACVKKVKAAMSLTEFRSIREIALISGYCVDAVFRAVAILTERNELIKSSQGGSPGMPETIIKLVF